MGEHCRLPEAESVAKLMTSLLGRAVNVKKGATLLKPGNQAAVSLYACDAGTVRAGCLFNLSLAAQAGAALSLIPKAMVEESIQSGTLTESIVDNFREIGNILSRLFNDSGAPHVFLNGVYLPSEPLPEDVAGKIAHPASRLDLDVTVTGYGVGEMSVLIF